MIFFFESDTEDRLYLNRDGAKSTSLSISHSTLSHRLSNRHTPHHFIPSNAKHCTFYLEVARSVQNKVEQCGGNACPRCGKCIDWSYNRDMYRDYKRYQRDNKCIELLDKNRWDRRPNATCSYYSYSSHAASYYDPYHYDYYDYGYYVCGCEK